MYIVKHRQRFSLCVCWCISVILVYRLEKLLEKLSRNYRIGGSFTHLGWVLPWRRPQVGRVFDLQSKFSDDRPNVQHWKPNICLQFMYEVNILLIYHWNDISDDYQVRVRNKIKTVENLLWIKDLIHCLYRLSVDTFSVFK